MTGTPAFFINGRLVLGAQPLESFVRVIEEELARALMGGHVEANPHSSPLPEGEGMTSGGNDDEYGRVDNAEDT